MRRAATAATSAVLCKALPGFSRSLVCVEGRTQPRSDSRLLDFWERGGVSEAGGEGEKRRESESSPEVKLAVTFAMPDFLIDPSKQLAHFVSIARF